MIKLREYQTKAIDAIKQSFIDNDCQYIEMPTGSGKTITFLSYARENHKKILLIVPSSELLKQVYSTSLIFFDKSNISRRGAGFKENIRNVHICIVNSIRSEYLKVLSRTRFDLVIIDEAHHIQSPTYKKFIDCLEYKPKILGVTATPDRLDGKLIKEILKLCSFKIEIKDLIKQKFLSDIEGYIVKTNINIQKMDNHNGDFSIGSLYKQLNTESRNNIIIKCMLEMKDRKVLIFCINIEHAININKLLNENGISSKCIYGSMNVNMKNQILKSFRNGEISVLCNCQLLTEGFDEPSIDGIILSRPTSSNSLFRQMIGRGLRIYPGKKNCKIIDIMDMNSKLSGIGSLVSENRLKPIESFSSFAEVEENVRKQDFEIKEITIQRSNFFNFEGPIFLEPTEAMIFYLESNGIVFYEDISFDEASFLIWKNELKKDFKKCL